MILLIDSGNTFTKHCLASSQGIGRITRALSRDKFVLNLRKTDVHSCIYSTVRNNVNEIERELQSLNISGLQMGPELRMPYSTSYSSPLTFGNDRKALISGALTKFPEKNCLVISMGTCITFDLIDKEANHLGGRIAPGMKMRFEALNNYTDKLPLLEPTKPIEHFGTSTTSSILSGVQMGIVSEINEAIRFARKEIGPLKAILTGGDSNFFDNNLKYEIFADPKLLFKGLYKIYTLNAANAAS